MKYILFTLALLSGACSMFAADGKSGEPLADAQRIAYHFGQTPDVPMQLKWKTILILPSGEKVLDVVCGFKDDWDVYAPKDSNFAMVTPLKAGVKTDLTLVTKSGNIYTFAVEDISNRDGAHAFTQVLIDVVDAQMKAALNDTPKYFTGDEVAAFKAQAAKAEQLQKDAAAKAAAVVEDAKASAQVDATKAIKHDYHFDQKTASKAPWNIAGIWHNDKFMFVEASPEEEFAVYEVKDGKPTAINIFPAGDGSFRTDRVLEAGYFKIGKRELKFSRGKAE